MATDLAEFVGAAIALNLLFHVPLFAAGLITAVIAFAILGAAEQGLPALRGRHRRAARAHHPRLPLRHAEDRLRRRRGRQGLHPGLRRDRLGAAGDRHPRRHGHAARDLPALGADAGTASRRATTPSASGCCASSASTSASPWASPAWSTCRCSSSPPRSSTTAACSAWTRSRRPTRSSRRWPAAGPRWPSRSRCWPRAWPPRAWGPTPGRWSCRASSRARSRSSCAGW